MYRNVNFESLGVTGRESELIELALSNGFKGLDLDIAQFGEQVRAKGLPLAKRLLVSSRLRLASFRLTVQLDAGNDEFKAQLAALPPELEIAREVKCERALSIIEPANDVRPYHENFELHRRRIAELAGVLAGFGLKLALGFRAPLHLRQGHAFAFMQTFEALSLLVKSIAAANVGVLLDLWQWHVGGGTIDHLRALGGAKIAYVGLADAEPGTTAESAQEESARLPGETGVIDSAAVLTALAEMKYDGPVTPWPHPSRAAGLGRDKIVKAASAALDRAWQAAGLNPAGKLAAAGRPS